jgi:hypothetical protein
MQSTVPAQRSGMVSGLSATFRFIGLLLGVAGLGAALGAIASRRFVAASAAIGLDPGVAANAARRVTAGDIAGALSGFPDALYEKVRAIASLAFVDGFAAACLVAAAVAGISIVGVFVLLRPVRDPV